MGHTTNVLETNARGSFVPTLRIETFESCANDPLFKVPTLVVSQDHPSESDLKCDRFNSEDGTERMSLPSALICPSKTGAETVVADHRKQILDALLYILVAYPRTEP